MNTTTKIPFSAIDYKGLDSLSSYALSVTPFRFISSTEYTKNTRMVWDFGDGTISKAFSAEKYYKFPGKYLVTLVQYDCNNNAMISSETKTVTIYDYYPLTMVPINYAYVVTETGEFVVKDDGGYVLASLLNLDVKCGQIEGEVQITNTFPAYQPSLDIYYSIRNSDSLNYWDIEDYKFSHLESYHSLFEKIYNYSLSSYQFNEIEKITPVVEEIYIKNDSGQLIRCNPLDSGSCFAGLTGISEFYFKNDTVEDQILLDLFYDKTNYVNPYQPNFKYLNNLGVTLSAVVADNTPTYLSITSNGLDGEKFLIDSFEINPIKYQNVYIPFVVKIKDFFNFSVKNFPQIHLSALDITVVAYGELALAIENGELLLTEDGEEIYATGTPVPLSLSSYDIISLNSTLSAQSFGGAFRGAIKFPTSDEVLTNIKIQVSGSFTNDQAQTFTLSGESNVFNVYPSNYFDIYKKNENFNATETIKDLRFQETLLDKTVLFDDFIGGILGSDLTHEEIGIKTYEKIANYVQNTQDLDKCEVDFLESLGAFVNYNDFADEKHVYPEKIKRLVNLLSIDKNKLLGTSNKFRENFDIKGRTSKTEYGRNIGDKIDPFTYIADYLTPIVALEKFSNEYVLLNTYQPVESTLSLVYPLSTYNSDWGWPLVLPVDFTFSDIGKYYEFFEYVDEIDGTVLGGVVDYDNSKTTIGSPIQYSDMYGDNGVIEHMFMDTLYQSLSLVNQ